MDRHGVLRLALGLAAVKGAAGAEQTSFEYTVKGRENGGKCLGAKRWDGTTSERADCAARCSKDDDCHFFSYSEGSEVCVLTSTCALQVMDPKKFTAYEKGAAVEPVAESHDNRDDAPDADMLDTPIRNKDQPDDKKTSNILKSTSKKTDKAASKLIEGMCPGEIDVEGDGPVQLINTVWNLGDDHAGEVKVEKGAVAPYMSGRTYFAESCTKGQYNHNEYVAMNLLGKTFAYTVDITDAGCGCNAALYLTNLRQNSNESECEDFYCDANNVCGVSCAEVDIMEANQHAWHSTLHTATDRDGAAVGYGGGGPGWSGPRDWTEKDYGPGGKCVDTEKPFRVAVSFPVNQNGVLKAMDVNLTQDGKPCSMQLSLNKYDGMKEMTEAFKAGMTPIISYWAADDMTWMDGAGDDMQGPCIKDNAKKCGDKVLMYDFAITPLKMSYESPHLKKPKTTTPPPEVRAAIKKQLAKELAAQEKEQAKEAKEKGIDQESGDQQGSWDQQGQQEGGDWNQQGDWDNQNQQGDWDKQNQQGDWDKQNDQVQQQGNDWDQQGDWDKQNDWNHQGDWDQQDNDWDNQQGQTSDKKEKKQNEQKEEQSEAWGQPWSSWDHSTPKPGQVWDGAGRPIAKEGSRRSSTTTTPCEESPHVDPVHCRPKLPGDPTRGGLKAKKEAEMDYLFKKNEALGPILRSAGPPSGATLAALVAGVAVLSAALASVTAWRRRAAAWQPASPPAAPDALAAAEATPQRPVGLLRAAPSSQSLLPLTAEAV